MFQLSKFRLLREHIPTLALKSLTAAKGNPGEEDDPASELRRVGGPDSVLQVKTYEPKRNGGFLKVPQTKASFPKKHPAGMYDDVGKRGGKRRGRAHSLSDAAAFDPEGFASWSPEDSASTGEALISGLPSGSVEEESRWETSEETSGIFGTSESTPWNTQEEESSCGPDGKANSECRGHYDCR